MKHRLIFISPFLSVRFFFLLLLCFASFSFYGRTSSSNAVMAYAWKNQQRDYTLLTHTYIHTLTRGTHSLSRIVLMRMQTPSYENTIYLAQHKITYFASARTQIGTHSRASTVEIRIENER